jgi:glycosyltransferase involved in cell wall biosynthesis
VTSLKVIHVITRLDWGGSARNTMLTVLGHDRSRFLPFVVAGHIGHWSAQGGSQATDANCEALDTAGVPWKLVPTLTREINPVKDLRALWSLVRLFRQERPTIVHTHTSKAGILGRVAAWLAGVPIIIHTPHGHVFYGHFGVVCSWVFQMIERVFARGTSKIITLTELEKQDHLQRHIGRERQFRSVFSGIDVAQYQGASEARKISRSRLGCSDEERIVGSVGWLTPIKGHQYLIQAISKLKPRYPNLQCHILGSGPLQEELMKLAADLGIGSAIRFPGYRQDVPTYLAAMDIFVLPSLNEGMGRALIEAMAAGLPVVATNVGGIPAIVQDGSTGSLVPPGNSELLAKALDRYLQSPERAKDIGAAARAHITEKFDVSSLVRGVEGVYEECLVEYAHAGAVNPLVT